MGATNTFRGEMVRAIEAYCSKHGITEAQFGRAVMDDGRLVDRIRAGQVSLRGLDKCEEVMSRPPSEWAPRRRAAAPVEPATPQAAA